MSAPASPEARARRGRSARVSRFGVPDLGVGVGFRVPHYALVAEQRPPMDWFEVLSENFMVDGGSPRHYLDRLLEAYPVVPHGVSLSLGGEGDPEHLERLAALVAHVDPPWVSDHLCFTGASGVHAHDLLPLPYTSEVAAHLVRRIGEVTARLGRVFAVENVSSYLTWRASRVPEWDFVADVLERADCALLLDVNNVFVSAMNHGFDPMAYLDATPLDRVVQIHLAGHSIVGDIRIDTHDQPVCDEVMDLYRAVIERVGPVSTLVEWDGNVPSWERLSEEAARVRAVRDEAVAVWSRGG